MSIFSNILSKIFPANHPAVATAPNPQTSTAPSPDVSGAILPTSAPASTAMMPVDIEDRLDTLALHNQQKLNWRTSIVDLMKLVELDSGLEARRSLAKELHYTGDMNDSANMNIWLHKQVMTKLAANGGKVPEDLKA